MPVTTADNPVEVLQELLNERLLRQRAGFRNFNDGEFDFDCGGVKGYRVENNSVIVTVEVDESSFETRISQGESELEFSCSCQSVPDPRRICKHSVCGAMAMLYDELPTAEAPEASFVSPSTLRTYLEEQEKESLLMLVLDRAEVDIGFRNNLSIRASVNLEPERRRDVVHACIDRLFKNLGYKRINQYYVIEAKMLIDALQELTSQLSPEEASGIVAYAFASARLALVSIEDHEGLMEEVYSALIGLELKVLERQKPDFKVLANEILERELYDEHNVFVDVIKRYDKILGKEGLEIYRGLLEELWGKVESGEEVPEELQLSSMMETLAELLGDLEKLVAIRSRALDFSDDYLQIALLYEKHGNVAKAVEWSEKGLNECERGASDLRDYLLDLYIDQGRTAEAIELLWSEFKQYPGVETYDELRGIAERLGEWSNWRTKALEYWNEALSDKRVKRTREMNSAFVEALLSESKIDEAWSAARDHGCLEDVWLKLAQLREKEHPGDAYPIYQKRVDQLLGLKHGIGIKDAAGLVFQIRDLMLAAGKQESDFTFYLNTLKSKHKSRKEFLALLK